MAENERMEQLLQEYKTDKSIGKLTELVEEMRVCQVHLPGKVDANKRVAAGIVKMPDGKSFIPIHTSKARVAGNVANGTQIIVLPFTEVVKIAANEAQRNSLDGILINPGKNEANIVFNMNLINKIHETEMESKNTGVRKAIQLTVPVANLDDGKISAEIEAFTKETDPQAKNTSLNKILSMLRPRNVIVPTGQNANGKIAPMVMTFNQTGEKYMPVYLDVNLMAQRHPESKASVLLFDKANEVTLSMESEILGMVIVTEKNMLHLKRPLLEKVKEINAQIAKDEKSRREDAEAEAMLVPEQKKFTMVSLPALLMSRGQKFVDELTTRKSAYIDELFENAYYNIRMYPYVAEEFNITLIGVSEGVDAFEIEFPVRDIGIGGAARAYIVWDGNKKKGRYFGICKNADNAMEIIEVTESGNVNHGKITLETNEMSAVLDIAEMENPDDEYPDRESLD